MGQLDDKVAVITGGGRGIGQAIAARFAAEGATIVVSSRTQADLDATLSAAGVGADRGLAVVADAMARDDTRRPVHEALERFGRVDVLVNNVGGTVGGRPDPFEGDDTTFEHTIVLSLTSAWWTTERGTSRDARTGIGAHHQHRVGRIDFDRWIGSLHDREAHARRFHEGACEVGRPPRHQREPVVPRHHAHVIVRHPVHRESAGMTEAEVEAMFSNDCLLHRILEPEEIAGMAVLLGGPDGDAITGQVLSVDGGYRV